MKHPQQQHHPQQQEVLPMPRARRSLPRPRLACPRCGAAPRLPVDLRELFRCTCGATLRVALTVAREETRTAEPVSRWCDR